MRSLQALGLVLDRTGGGAVVARPMRDLSRHPAPCRRLGLIVNPIAGLGGAVGLKGTDAADALALGAVPRSGARATQALRALAPLPDRLELVTWAGTMGGLAARAAGLAPLLLPAIPGEPTTAADTRALMRAGVEPLVMQMGHPGRRGTILPPVEPGIAAAVGAALELVPASMRRALRRSCWSCPSPRCSATICGSARRRRGC